MTTGDAATDTRLRERFLLDHRRIEDLLKQVIRAFEDGDRERVASVWNLFDAELLAHMQAEEQYLIPRLLSVNERAARAILEEHKHFRGRLTELGAGVDLHIVRLAAARAFVDELQAHAAHEDRVLYAWADLHVDEAVRTLTLTSLADKLKAKLLARAGVLP